MVMQGGSERCDGAGSTADVCPRVRRPLFVRLGDDFVPEPGVLAWYRLPGAQSQHVTMSRPQYWQNHFCFFSTPGPPQARQRGRSSCASSEH